VNILLNVKLLFRHPRGTNQVVILY